MKPIVIFSRMRRVLKIRFQSFMAYLRVFFVNEMKVIYVFWL